MLYFALICFALQSKDILYGRVLALSSKLMQKNLSDFL